MTSKKLKRFAVEFVQSGVKTILAENATDALNKFYRRENLVPKSATQNHPRAKTVDVLGQCTCCHKLITKDTDLRSDCEGVVLCKTCYANEPDYL